MSVPRAEEVVAVDEEAGEATLESVASNPNLGSEFFDAGGEALDTSGEPSPLLSWQLDALDKVHDQREAVSQRYKQERAALEVRFAEMYGAVDDLRASIIRGEVRARRLARTPRSRRHSPRLRSPVLHTSKPPPLPSSTLCLGAGWSGVAWLVVVLRVRTASTARIRRVPCDPRRARRHR